MKQVLITSETVRPKDICVCFTQGGSEFNSSHFTITLVHVDGTFKTFSSNLLTSNIKIVVKADVWKFKSGAGYHFHNLLLAFKFVTSVMWLSKSSEQVGRLWKPFKPLKSLSKTSDTTENNMIHVCPSDLEVIGPFVVFESVRCYMPYIHQSESFMTCLWKFSRQVDGLQKTPNDLWTYRDGIIDNFTESTTCLRMQAGLYKRHSSASQWKFPSEDGQLQDVHF